MHRLLPDDALEREALMVAVVVTHVHPLPRPTLHTHTHTHTHTRTHARTHTHMRLPTCLPASIDTIVFLSCSADQTLKVWDVRNKTGAMLSVKVKQGEGGGVQRDSKPGYVHLPHAFACLLAWCLILCFTYPLPHIYSYLAGARRGR